MTSPRSPLRPWARPLLALVSAVSLLAPIAAAHGAPADGAVTPGHLDRGLVAQLAHGAAPAVLAWDDGATERADVLARLRASGVEHHAFSHLDMAVVCVADAVQAKELAGMPGVVSLWGEEELEPLLGAEAPALLGVTAPAAGAGSNLGVADLELSGDGIGVAVLDTGIFGHHADVAYGPRTVLNARVIVSHYEILGVGQDTCAPDTYHEDIADSETVSGQGTHLAGVAAGDGSAGGSAFAGVAPGADLIGVSVIEQITPEHEGEVKASLIRFIASVNYLLSNALLGGPTTAKVALLGWGRPGLYDPWHPHFLAVRDLHDFGIAPVVPVGNGGSAQSDCSRAEFCTFNPMAVGTGVIAVGATEDGELADYSSRGDPLVQQARNESVFYQPTVVAPGTASGPWRPGLAALGTPAGTSPYALQSSGGVGTDPNYQALTGTAVAAAHVAGVVALMQEAAREVSGCYLSPFQVKHLLAQTATPLDGRQQWEVGGGAVDAAAAVAAAADQPAYGGPNPWDCA